jgi:cytoskeletal protein CcmA (bactofilin family)
MLGNPKKTEKDQPLGETSVLALGTTIEGNISTTESIRLDGTVIGNVSCERRLVLGEGSRIVGDVKANEASVNGNIDGNVIVRGLLQLLKTGKIKGSIRAEELKVEQGASYEGTTSVGSYE